MRTPILEVSIGGQDYTSYLMSLFALDAAAPRLAPSNLDISITDNAGGEADKLNLTFARRGRSAPPKSGDKVLAALGYKETGVVAMGTFTVDQPSSKLDKSGGRTITITATSADMTGKLKEQRHEGHKERTVEKVVNKIAGRNGLTPTISPALKAIAVPQADQTHESDMHFLSRIAQDLGARFKVVEGRLLFIERRGGVTAGGAPKIAHILGPTDIISAAWTGSERQAHGTVKAGYHDQGAGKRMFAEAKGEGDTEKVLKKTYATKELAQRAAEEDRKNGQASRDTMEVEIEGNPFIRAEHRLVLPALEVEHAGEWSVETHIHKVTKGSGYTGSLSLERPV